jgi:tetratricopeptide (TPR) repeat protein
VLGEPRPILPTHAREGLVEASLAASRLLGVSRRSSAVSVAAEMREDGLPDYLQLAIVIRQSTTLRLEGYHDRSDILIQDVLSRILVRDIRSHCLYGCLLFSRAENAILRKEFDRAQSYLGQWEVKNDPPFGYELQVLRMKNTVIGRLSQYQGDFPYAEHCLKTCLQTIPTETSRFHVMHHLAGVYCEQGLAEKAEELLIKDIEDLRARGKQRSKAFKRLLLPFAEACLEQRKMKEARAALSELGVIFDGADGHDVSDQLDHVRSILGLVRIAYHESQWSEALESSQKAFVLAQKYKTFEDRSFYIGVILLFRTVIHFELGQLPESQRAYASAMLYDQGPWHFLPGIGTHVLQLLISRIKSLQ